MDIEQQGQELDQESNNPEIDSSPSQATQSEPTEQPSVLDLDSVDKFKLEGREMTLADLRKSMMLHEDYTRKTQEFSQERKFYDNLGVDLSAVKLNPALAAQFKSVYPKKFHSYLDYVLSTDQGAQATQGKQAQQGVAGQPTADPKLLERLEKIESKFHADSQKAIEAEIDATFTKLGSKYPMADEGLVIARAEALLDKIRQEQGDEARISEKQWDALFKSVHDATEKRFKDHYSKQVQKQTQANQKGKDGASGGGIPSQAPRHPKSIKEATPYFLEELEKQ